MHAYVCVFSIQLCQRTEALKAEQAQTPTGIKNKSAKFEANKPNTQ